MSSRRLNVSLAVVVDDARATEGEILTWITRLIEQSDLSGLRMQVDLTQSVVLDHASRAQTFASRLRDLFERLDIKARHSDVAVTDQQSRGQPECAAYCSGAAKGFRTAADEVLTLLGDFEGRPKS